MQLPEQIDGRFKIYTTNYAHIPHSFLFHYDSVSPTWINLIIFIRTL